MTHKPMKSCYCTDCLIYFGSIQDKEAKEAKEITETLEMAVDWWLSEGREQFYGAPGWVFKAREILDNPKKDT